MKIPELKYDPEMPHHYFICVMMNPLNMSDPGKFVLRYGPVHFTNDDIDKMQLVIITIQDKIYKINAKEAMLNQDVYWLYDALVSCKLVADAEKGVICHYTSEEKLPREYFETLVESANNSNYGRRLIENARVRW
jgi:hypothetical protein